MNKQAEIEIREKAVVDGLESKGFVFNKLNLGGTIPRRNQLDLNTTAELAIHNAMQEVEKMAADTRLTNATILLSKAKDSVSDFIDNIESKPDNKDEIIANQKQIIGLQEIVISNLEKANAELRKV